LVLKIEICLTPFETFFLLSNRKHLFCFFYLNHERNLAMARQEKELIKPQSLNGGGGGGDPTDPKEDGGTGKSGLGLHRPHKRVEENDIPYLRLTLEMPYDGRGVNVTITER
jgi:hypothetical protein